MFLFHTYKSDISRENILPQSQTALLTISTLRRNLTKAFSATSGGLGVEHIVTHREQ